MADITAGNLKFVPDANENGAPYATFTFQVRDDGGTANSGVDLDPTPNTMTVNVTRGERRARRDEQHGHDERGHGATRSRRRDFGFTDPNDTPANAWRR